MRDGEQRMARRGLVAAALAAAVAQGLGGCVVTPAATLWPDEQRAEDFSPPAAQALVVVLPQRPIAGFERGQAQLDAQLGRQLQAAGWRVQRIGLANHEALWAAESAGVGGVFDPATGAPRPQALLQAQAGLAQTVCAEAGCALLVQAELVRRTGRLQGHSAAWDGVVKPVPVLRGAAGQVRLSGSTPTLSVSLRVWRADGRLAFRGLGGHEVPFVAQLADSRAAPRTDLFDDETAMAEAVRLALRLMAPPAAR